MKPGRLHQTIFALPLLCALAAFPPSRALAASNVEITAATLSPAIPCAGDTATLSVTLQDLTSTAFTPYLYATAQFPSVGCGSGGFNTSEGLPYLVWDVYAGTDPNASNPAYSFPNTGGWQAPVSLSYTGQTYTINFQVAIPGTDDANSLQVFEIGASSTYQNATGADSYYCLTYTTCATQGSMVPTATASPTQAGSATISPTFTASPTFSASPTTTPTFTGSPTWSASPTATPSLTAADTASPSPTQTQSGIHSNTETPTPSPSPTLTNVWSITPTPSPSVTVSLAESATPTRVTSALETPGIGLVSGMDIRPNFVRGGGSMAISIRSADGGMVSLRVLRQNGRQLRSLYRNYLAPRQGVALAWDTNDAEGAPAASGVYYIVFTDGGGRNIVQKVLVVR